MVSDATWDDLVIEKITPSDDLSGFNCGDEDLNEFLKKDSLEQMAKQLNVTYLCKYNNKIIAFFTLSSDSIKINRDDKHIVGINYSEYPALKLGRLGVDKRFRQRGLGTQILLLVVGCLFKLSKRVGMRFISVNAYKKSVNFYRKNNFVELEREKSVNQHVSMYFDPLRLRLEWISLVGFFSPSDEIFFFFG